ncbi:MAG: ABC-F family ATP-binding cassette domain-containing protein, partial [Lachnospiraceae bacterium]|nr:ABC-F family ATP-binding cassette domain-containing protein [Lachnospiraceae bacterium]
GPGRLLKKKMKAVKSMEKRFEREDENMTEMPEEDSAIFFKLCDKNVAIPAGKRVLEYSLDKLYTPDGERVLSENIELNIRGSEKICIVGRNGTGKTTLLRKIAKELLSRSDIHAEYMPQNYEDLLKLDMTPVDYLDSSGDKEERTRIRTYLGALKYTADEMDHPIAELSGGQKAKVLLLKMSMSGANVLILDEPTRNFSPLSGPVIRRMLSEFPGAIISISHDRKYIDEVCDKIYEFTDKGLECKETQ